MINQIILFTKKINRSKFLIAQLIVIGLGLMPLGLLKAQVFTILHSFILSKDGSEPRGDLILSGDTLYGTATDGGTNNGGTLFKVNKNGTGFTILHNFTDLVAKDYYTYVNSDGTLPESGLVLLGGRLYGTANRGGSFGYGTLYSVKTDGTDFITHHHFTGGEAYPSGALIFSGNTLYGTTNSTIFKINSDGTGFTRLYQLGFTEGGLISSKLVLLGNTLYGTAYDGGNSNNGAVFKINIDGSGFTILHSFSALIQDGPYPYTLINSDGASPYAGLMLSGNTLYGTTSFGGIFGSGTIFSINADGTGFTTLYNFTKSNYGLSINTDGARPYAGLTLSNKTLYGTTNKGGSAGGGTIFSINMDGTGFKNLYNFGSRYDGANPFAGVVLADNKLYGAVGGYGSSTFGGTVFSVSNCILPTAPSASGITICNGSFASIAATGVGTLGWYNAATGGNYLGGGAIYITPTLTASTTYYVQDSTCASSATRTPVVVTVNPLPPIPTITAAGKTTFCNGGSVILNSSSTSGNQWYKDGAIITGATNPTYTVNTGGIYTDSVTNINGCSIGAKLTVIVNSQPKASFSSPASQCLKDNNFIFTSTSNINEGAISSIQWSFGDSLKSTISPVSHSFAASGIYGVKLVVMSNNGCIDSILKNISVFTNPTASIVTNRGSAFCPGDSMILNANVIAGTGTISSYQWYNNNVFVPGATSNHLAVFQSGNFTVEVTNSNTCLTKSSVFAVTKDTLPIGILSIPDNKIICQGGNVLLSASGGVMYQWYLNNIPINGADAFNYAATNVGNYTVQLINQTGCKNFASGTVTLALNKKPAVDFIYDSYCINNPINFTNRSDFTQSGPVTMVWDFGDSTQSTSVSPTHTFSDGRNYITSLRVIPANCPALESTMSQLIKVENPQTGIRYTPVNAIKNTDLSLQARNIGIQYYWYPSTGLNNYLTASPTFNYNNPGQYVIKIINKAGCTTYDSLNVLLFSQTDIFVPKAFSPNGDGHNDKLSVFLVGIKKLNYFKVFNRWGKMVFETNSPDVFWEGNFNGTKQPSETYIWVAEGIGIDGSLIYKKGQTVLIR